MDKSLTPERELRIRSTEEKIKAECLGESSGHDWWHIDRVRKTALKLANAEGADLYICEMAALLHDLDDWKFNATDEPLKAASWLREMEEQEEIIHTILSIIKEISFKGAGVATEMTTVEGKCVQDADRLDAIGAIGVARAFAYGGAKNREMHNPEIEPIIHESFAHYKTNNGPTLNHFYEKLFLLKDRMQTDSGRKLAEERHQFMEVFVNRFLSEWG